MVALWEFPIRPYKKKRRCAFMGGGRGSAAAGAGAQGQGARARCRQKPEGAAIGRASGEKAGPQHRGLRAHLVLASELHPRRGRGAAAWWGHFVGPPTRLGMRCALRAGEYCMQEGSGKQGFCSGYRYKQPLVPGAGAGAAGWLRLLQVVCRRMKRAAAATRAAVDIRARGCFGTTY